MLEDVVFTPEFLKKKGRALARTAPNEARLVGFEPTTRGLRIRRSVTPVPTKVESAPLSYRRLTAGANKDSCSGFAPG